MHCTGAGSLRFGKRTLERKPSPFLDRIMGRSAPDKPQTSQRRNATNARRIRESLGVEHLEPAQQELREEIRQWRLNTARATGVPAYVVFPDRTLDALVIERPSTHEELARIPGLGAKKLARYGDNILELLEGSG